MTIVFDGRFHTGASFSDYNRVDREPSSADIPPLAAGRAGEYEIVNDPLLTGLSVAKLTMQASSPGRMELRPLVEDFNGASGPDFGTRWYACWLMIPSEPEFELPPASGVDVDTDLVSNHRTLIMQLHQTEGIGEATFPAFQLAIDQNGYTVILTYDATHPSVSRIPNLRVMRNIPVVRNRWEEWVLKVRYAWDNNGSMEFYRNRRRLFSFSGSPTGYNDVVGPFIKFGLYGYSLVSWSQSRTLYTRGIVIGDGNANYEEVTGHPALEVAAVRALT